MREREKDEEAKGRDSGARARVRSLSSFPSLPIISDRREGAEPRRRDCNAIAARLKSAIAHTHAPHTPPRRAHKEHTPVSERSAGCNGAATRERRA